MTESEMQEKLAQAYQVIAQLSENEATDSEIERALDYFSSTSFDADFLPWPSSSFQI